MQDERETPREPGGTPGTSEVEAVPDAGRKPTDAPRPGKAPGTSEVEAMPEPDTKSN